MESNLQCYLSIRNFEDIRIRTSKKNRQHNCKKKSTMTLIWWTTLTRKRSHGCLLECFSIFSFLCSSFILIILVNVLSFFWLSLWYNSNLSYMCTFYINEAGKWTCWTHTSYVSFIECLDWITTLWCQLLLHTMIT
jgi:hypothetical protein